LNYFFNIILKNGLDTLKTKVREANTQNYEANNKVKEMNKKIDDFNKDWYRYKQSSFATILRSIVDAFYENVYQYKDIFKEIVTYNNLPENPQLKSKKSIIYDSPLIHSERNLMRMSTKKSPNLENDDRILEKNEEKNETNSIATDKSKKTIRKPTNIFSEARDNYFEFNEHLKSLKINVEDEHLKDLDENEIVHIFKTVFIEMNKKFDDYKLKLNDSIKYYKEIKECYLEELIKGKETYMNSLGELLHNKFIKTFEKKSGNYLALFEIIIMKLRDYSEKFKEYLDVKVSKY